MTDEQNDHMTWIAERAKHKIVHKYAAGQAEHGGNLWDQTEDQLLDNAILEAIDQVIYLLTLRKKITDAHIQR